MKRRIIPVTALIMALIMLLSATAFAAPGEDRLAAGAHTDGLYVTLDGEEFNLLTLGGAVGALSHAKTEKQLKYIAFSVLERLFKNILSLLADSIPDPVTVVGREDYRSENFLPGSPCFLNSPAAGAKWSLGYAQESLVPEDVLTRNYYLGGYLLQNFPSNTVESVLDDMKVRVVVLDDASGRGKSVFASVDCIGIANTDVRLIRALLSDFARQNGIASINVFATHCHSCIDTQGLWNPFLLKLVNNIVSSATGFGTLIPGPDEKYMSFLRSTVADTVKAAVADMEPGRLYISRRDISPYIFESRGEPNYLGTLTRLRFTPDSGGRETLFVNMNAHPYIVGLKTDNSSGKELSGDYVYYMEEIVNAAGYDFMFINGAILGSYTASGLSADSLPETRRSDRAVRYGHELGRMTVAMAMTESEIDADALLADKANVARERNIAGEDYTLWYEDWQVAAEAPVEPILNIRLAEVEVGVDGEVMEAAGKSYLANTRILKTADGYSTVTEIGYIEIGTAMRIVMMPGEFSPDLVNGKGAYLGENSFSGLDFPLPPLNETLGCETVVFGLANDAFGYILPDTDYCMIFFDGDFFGSHYQETISPGKATGSTLVSAFMNLYDSVK